MTHLLPFDARIAGCRVLPGWRKSLGTRLLHSNDSTHTEGQLRVIASHYYYGFLRRQAPSSQVRYSSNIRLEIASNTWKVELVRISAVFACHLENARRLH